MLKKNTTCRDCGSSKLHLFIDLNDQPPANAFAEAHDTEEQVFPLKTAVCEDCSLVQLLDVVDIDTLFQNYVYFSAGAGLTLPAHFTKYADDVTQRFNLNAESRVVELGSNDGLLLRAFKERGVVNVLGVDPAKNVAEYATSQGVETIAEPWSVSVAERIKAEKGLADIIIGNNVVAHIDDHVGLFTGVKTLLAPQGVFIFEAPYLIDMFTNLAFDTIYHEHLSCLSLRPIKRLVESLGLEVIDIEFKKVQGLSMRVFIGHKGAHTVSPHVEEAVAREVEMGMDKVETYVTLANRIHERKREIVELLAKLKAEGARIAGYGAPAKGNTLLNFFDIGTDTLEYLTEELPTKVGRFSPGKKIPTVHVEEARKSPPDYFLLLAWNYADSILEREKAMREAGTKFIIPIGEQVIII